MLYKLSDTYIKNGKDFLSWCYWNLDLYADLLRPDTGGFFLDLDQRIFLRVVGRFYSTYGCFPRGWGKTVLECLAMYLVASIVPDIQLRMTAQTLSNASALLQSKHNEIMKFYPLLEKEIVGKPKFSENAAEVKFASGAVISVLANAQSSKGQRCHRLQIEESALLNDELYQDVLKPIPNQPRRTIGRLACVNPTELNSQINFFTTTGFRGSSEFYRNIEMLKSMANCEGKFVFGSDWRLAESFGRGLTKSQILEEMENTSQIFFDQNYNQKWVGAVSGALVDINKLLNLRSYTKPELTGDGKSEYILGCDVARSEDTSNNRTSIAVIKIIRNKNKRIQNLALVNMIDISNDFTFDRQCLEIKRIKKRYKAKAIISDSNGVGKGLL